MTRCVLFSGTPWLWALHSWKRSGHWPFGIPSLNLSNQNYLPVVWGKETFQGMRNWAPPSRQTRDATANVHRILMRPWCSCAFPKWRRGECASLHMGSACSALGTGQHRFPVNGLQFWKSSLLLYMNYVPLGTEPGFQGWEGKREKERKRGATQGGRYGIVQQNIQDAYFL